MLAGNMKLKNFIAIVVIVVCAGITGAYLACHGGSKEPDKPVAKPPEPKPAEPPKPAERPVEPVTNPAPPPGKRTVDDLAARPEGADVVEWRNKSITGDKLKDAARGKPYKLDLYKDAGSTTVDRAKLDLNRNGKWDEKYTFKGDEVVLERAPADDEKYTD